MIKIWQIRQVWQKNKIHLALQVCLISLLAQLNKKISLGWIKQILYSGRKINPKNLTYFLHNNLRQQTHFLGCLLLRQGYSIWANQRNSHSKPIILNQKRSPKYKKKMTTNNNLYLSHHRYLISYLNKKAYKNQFFL